MPAVLKITDGTTAVSLIKPEDQNGFHLAEWTPAISGYKAGGTWQNSPLAEGRRLVDKRFENVIETFELKLNGATQDETIREGQRLRRLLEKASSYWTSYWQDEPVWIEARATCETNTRYAIIFTGRIPQDDNFFAQPFLQPNGAVMDELTLVIERGAWTANSPGESQCVEATGIQEGWEYENWAIITALPTGYVFDIVETNAGTLLATTGPGGVVGEILRSVNGSAWVDVTPVGFQQGVDFAINGSTIYLAGHDAAGTGMFWRSTNDGLNWTLIYNVIGNIETNCLIYASDGYLYLNSTMNIAPGMGVYRSTDGITWTYVLSFPAGIAGAGQCVEQANDGTLYASVRNQLYRSIDGVTWSVAAELESATETTAMIKEVGVGTDVQLLWGLYNNPTPWGKVYLSSNGFDWIEVFPQTTLTVAQDSPTDVIRLTDGSLLLAISPAAPNVDFYRSLDGMIWTQYANVLGAGAVFKSLVQFSGDGRIYGGETGDIWRSGAPIIVGRSDTCTEEVFIANRQNVAQLTNVMTYNGAAWTQNFPAAAFPYQLLPNPLVNGHAVVFSIDTSVFDSGPFASVIVDITTVASGTYTLTWYYASGAAAFPPPGANWTALNLNDETLSFRRAGVNGLFFEHQSDWTEIAINGVTGFHIVGIISGVAGAPVGPQQGNRDPYTVNWPDTNVDELQVPGDIPAIMRAKLGNQTDLDGPVGSAPDQWSSRYLVGLRSISRGSTFVSFLNWADEQNPIGTLVSAGTNTAFAADVETATGRRMTHTTDGASAWNDEAIITFDPTIVGDYYGRFHVFFRAQQVDRSSEMGEVLVRLQVQTGLGGVTFTSESQAFPNLNDWQLMDLGQVPIPGSDVLSNLDLGDESRIALQIWSSVAQLTVYLYDLALIPVDEWAGDFVDKALEDDSGVENGCLMDIDSLAYPKRDVRAMNRLVGSEYVRSIYQPVTGGPAVLQSNADQNLYFLVARGIVTGAHTGANNQTTLTDANASFLTSFVETGQVIFNVTDGSTGVVGATVTATTITDCGLAGGTDNDWDTNDVYLILAPNWRSEPWTTHSVQLFANPRYLSARGSQ